MVHCKKKNGNQHDKVVKESEPLPKVKAIYVPKQAVNEHEKNINNGLQPSISNTSASDENVNPVHCLDEVIGDPKIDVVPDGELQSRNYVLRELSVEEQVQNIVNGDDHVSVEYVYDESCESPVRDVSVQVSASAGIVADSLEGNQVVVYNEGREINSPIPLNVAKDLRILSPLWADAVEDEENPSPAGLIDIAVQEADGFTTVVSKSQKKKQKKNQKTYPKKGHNT